MPLEASQIQGLQPKAQPYKVTDGAGLYLQIIPSGARYWRFRFRWAGKQNTLSCGVYPEVSLEEARARRDAARQLLADGINPAEHAKLTCASLRDEQARQVEATRFMIDSNGALSFRLGKRCLSLSTEETASLREFLHATSGVIPKR